MQPAPKSFTVNADSILRVLLTRCAVAPAFDPTTTSPGKHPKHQDFDAIWDTGATNTVISPQVVNACNLKPFSMAQVHTASGTSVCEVYLVNIALPNGVAFANVPVTNQPLTGAHVLIGMDIMGMGDFAVTNKGGKTTFSFRFPSMERIDFVKSSPIIPAIGRNDPCPCGSGKKYKKCHGAIS